MEILNIEQTPIKIKFEVTNTSVAFINCLRRICSSLCPTISFDDTYFEDISLNSINIKKNTSSLHNEFLSHRISLIPIKMNNQNLLNFYTKYDFSNKTRIWEFSNIETIPVFNLKLKNNIDTIMDVTTENFKVQSLTNELDIKEYFSKDHFTDEYILINKLKCNLVEQSDGQELDIECIPKIGMGKYNSRNDPTGTVKYSFKCDDEEKITEIFNLKIKHLQQERISKKLKEFSDDEILKMRRSFNLLDKDRVYIKNTDGEASHFVFSIESIGFMDPKRIIVNSIHSLILELIDIRSSFNFKNVDGKLSLECNYNVETLINLDDNINVIIEIKNQNHTIGNIIKDIIYKKYVSNDNNKEFPFKIGGYVMEHPTIEKIDFKFVIKDNITKENIIEKIYLDFQSHNELSKISKINYNQIDEYDLKKIYVSTIFIKSINEIITMYNDFLDIFTSVFNIDDTTPDFEISDSENYLTINNFINM